MVNSSKEMKRSYFSKEQAEAQLGKRIRSLVEFSGVPVGTTGTVVAFDEIYPEGFDVVIEWDLADRLYGAQTKPLRDWFTRGEFEGFLVEC